jgi:hypothetical protein
MVGVLSTRESIGAELFHFVKETASLLPISDEIRVIKLDYTVRLTNKYF